MPYILALDQGTTSSRAIVFGEDGSIHSLAQKEFQQYFPHAGWVEHDPDEIWASQMGVAIEALGSAKLSARNIAALSITNQRGNHHRLGSAHRQALYNAIVWQDRRTAGSASV
ncbi:MAG: FGGY family carbohydrate kinase [Vicinamibacterales bacterium]